MHKLISYSIITGFILLLTSCGKSINETHPEFIGFWKSKEEEKGVYTFTFNEDGSGKHGFIGSGKIKNHEGKFRVKNDQLTLGLRRYTIDRFPYDEEEYTEMVVDDVIYFKIEN